MSALPAVRAALLLGGMLAAASLIPHAQAQEAPQQARSEASAEQADPAPRIDFRDPTAQLSSGQGASKEPRFSLQSAT